MNEYSAGLTPVRNSKSTASSRQKPAAGGRSVAPSITRRTIEPRSSTSQATTVVSPWPGRDAARRRGSRPPAVVTSSSVVASAGRSMPARGARIASPSAAVSRSPPRSSITSAAASASSASSDTGCSPASESMRSTGAVVAWSSPRVAGEVQCRGAADHAARRQHGPNRSAVAQLARGGVEGRPRARVRGREGRAPDREAHEQHGHRERAHPARDLPRGERRGRAAGSGCRTLDQGGQRRERGEREERARDERERRSEHGDRIDDLPAVRSGDHGRSVQPELPQAHAGRDHREHDGAEGHARGDAGAVGVGIRGRAHRDGDEDDARDDRDHGGGEPREGGWHGIRRHGDERDARADRGRGHDHRDRLDDGCRKRLLPRPTARPQQQRLPRPGCREQPARAARSRPRRSPPRARSGWGSRPERMPCCARGSRACRRGRPSRIRPLPATSASRRARSSPRTPSARSPSCRRRDRRRAPG